MTAQRHQIVRPGPATWTAHRQRGQFLVGLASGLLLGLAGLLLAGAGGRELLLLLQPMWEMAQLNLRGSALLFLLLLLIYLDQLFKLRASLALPVPAVDRVARQEQLLDLCANLFFGVGVIWTAIGMRDALLFALGEPGDAATQGAFAVLQRLVDGGILLALSTTIVGGIGGYLMRAAKSLLFGQALAALYLASAEAPTREGIAILQRIEQRLGPPSDSEQPTP